MNWTDPIQILGSAYLAVQLDFDMTRDQKIIGCHNIVRAIMHLAKPDRRVYPKTRRGTKGHPVVRA